MKRILLATAGCAAVFATPALAGADGPYIGIEGGATFPRSTDYDVSVTHGTTTTDYGNGYQVKSKTGYDVDAIAGYKMGMFRLEGEAAYKRANVKSLSVSTPLLTGVGTVAGVPVTQSNFDSSGHTGVASLMANALLDFGGPGLGAYVGGGAGRAWVSYSGDKDSAFAYQGIAGVRTAITPNIDVGLKYRYFRTGSLNFSDGFAINGQNFTTNANGKYASHSLLASLVYNFNSGAPAPIPAAAPAPAPAAPAAPATQTCPDGTVILATDVCPAPPPPPPPPPPAANSGERGQ